MKGIKVIFITMEIVMLLGIALFVFLTDWVEVEKQDVAWMFKLIIVLLSILAVIYQCEQQKIKWNEEEE